jgi:Uma2 family endonuclease
MSLAMEDWPRRHRISVEEYHRMAEVGLLAPDARVELIDGEIIEMPPIGSRHGAIVDRLTELFMFAVQGRANVRCQGAIQLGDFSEPQPDLSLLERREDFYSEKHPREGQILLAIEVSESTLNFDRKRNMSLYARYAIPEFWVFDVEGKQLLVFRNPSGAAYTDVSSMNELGIMAVSALPGLSVDLSKVFGYA